MQIHEIKNFINTIDLPHDAIIREVTQSSYAQRMGQDYSMMIDLGSHTNTYKDHACEAAGRRPEWRLLSRHAFPMPKDLDELRIQITTAWTIAQFHEIAEVVSDGGLHTLNPHPEPRLGGIVQDNMWKQQAKHVKKFVQWYADSYPGTVGQLNG